MNMLDPYVYLPAEFRKVFLPYVLQRIEDGRYVILNRYNKPLGHYTNARVDYAEYAVHIRGMGPKTAQRLSCEDSTNQGAIYLYKDGCIPTASKAAWDAYQRRLACLGKLTVEA